jgi:hypothetical protein
MAKSQQTEKRRGAPTKPDEAKRSQGISVWVDSATKERISRAAALHGDGAGRWLGKIGDAAAKAALGIT